MDFAENRRNLISGFEIKHGEWQEGINKLVLYDIISMIFFVCCFQ